MFNPLKKFELIFKTWPIRPLPLAILLTLFQILVNLAIVIASARALGAFVTPQQLLATVPSLIMGFSFGFVVLTIIQRLTLAKPLFAAWFYWLGALLFGLSMALARFLSISDYTPQYWKDPASSVRIFIVTALLYLVVHVTLGVSNLRLEEQVKAAQAAQASLEIQRGKLISAQEDVRRQIADFLHDRLQSDLVLLGMQMKRSSEKLSDQEQAIAQAYIDEIERIRQFDVRNVSRQLAPELDGPSFRPALEDLIERYSKVMTLTLALKEKGKLSQSLKLGSYRIIEQALLNVAKHANAKHVAIDVQENEDNLKILVQNDGLPLPSKPVAGAGFAIIEDWVSQLGGDWSISSNKNGTELRVTLQKKN